MKKVIFIGYIKMIWNKYFHQTLILSLPLILSSFSQILLGIIDLLMVASLGVVAVASVAFVNILAPLMLTISFGLSSAFLIKIAYAYGAKNVESGAEEFRYAMIFSVITGIAQCFFFIGLMFILAKLGQPEEVVAMTPPYLFWVALSLIPATPALVLKSFTDAQNDPWAGVSILLATVILNIVLNYMLIHGHWGAPKLGLLGAGVATFIARTMAFFAIFFYVFFRKKFRAYHPKKWFKPIKKSQLMDLLAMSLAISGQGLIMYGAFSITAIFMGIIGTVALASHQIALVCAMSGSIIPWGISFAVTIRVGHALGESKVHDTMSIFIGAQCLSGIVMGGVAALFMLQGRALLGVFFTELELIDFTTSLLFIVGAYQLFDSSQIISLGALRGYKDVYKPTMVLFSIFWLFALPFGAVLAFYLQYGGLSLWVGLAIGIMVCAVTLTLRFICLYRLMLSRH
ncbi:MATE family efflux transporter [uncultured Shewanella sp.]|uniref:MATE family efflux transporter n=1 Tax=uncultured Shewanella sp. TaxID=173975 RepID=UPI00261AF780|nr:MATE family efflux transporter [uncultured Shewanella sp.]